MSSVTNVGLSFSCFCEPTSLGHYKECLCERIVLSLEDRSQSLFFSLYCERLRLIACFLLMLSPLVNSFVCSLGGHLLLELFYEFIDLHIPLNVCLGNRNTELKCTPHLCSYLRTCS